MNDRPRLTQRQLDEIVLAILLAAAGIAFLLGVAVGLSV